MGGMDSSVDKSGQLVWWFDMADIDMTAIKTEVSHVDSLRAFVWYAHGVLYNRAAQDHGMVFVENMAKAGFISSMTMVPMKLGTKLDRLTIGVLPIKMNALYILETPTWCSMLMKFLGTFMSKKMKQRIVILKEWAQLEELVGKDCVPKGFGKLEGCHEKDLVRSEYQ